MFGNNNKSDLEPYNTRTNNKSLVSYKKKNNNNNNKSLVMNFLQLCKNFPNMYRVPLS